MLSLKLLPIAVFLSSLPTLLGQIYQQNFDALTAGTLPAGWTANTGTWTVQTTGNFSSPNAFGEAAAGARDTVMYTAMTAIADMSMTGIEIVNTPDTMTGNIGCALRASDDGQNGYFVLPRFHVAAPYGEMFIFKRVAGVYTLLTNLPTPAGNFPSLAAGDFARFKCAISGSSIQWKLWRNGTAEPGYQTFTDSAIGGTGKAGLYSGNNLDGTTTGASTVDDLRIDNVIFPVTDANVFWSPYTWYSDGVGAVQPNNINGGSTFAQSIYYGAYLKTKFTGTSVTINIDVSGVTSGGFPMVGWVVDGGAPQTRQLLTGDTTVAVASGLSAGTHTLYFDTKSLDVNQDRWNAPVSALKITGITLDTGATLSAPSVLSKNILFLGDSITEGELTEGPISGGIITNSDSQHSWIAPVAAALSAEYGNSGLGGTGWLAVWANANAPALSTSYSQFFGTHSRLVAGKFSPMPDYVVINHGTNDRSTADASVTTAVTSILPSIRAAVNTSTPIFVIVPFGQFKASAITAGVTGDSNTHLLNLGASFANGLDGNGTSPEASDGFHPYAATDARLGAEVARLILVNISQGGSTISGRCVISGNVTIR